MHTNKNETSVSRRRFLKRAAITAIAATATGAGAAKLAKQSSQSLTTIAPFAAVNAPATAVSASQSAITPFRENPTELLANLAAVQAENVRLQTALGAAQSQLDTFNQSNQETAVHSEALTLELAAKNDQITVLAGLVALYEQLDEIDWPTFWENGVTAVSGTLTELLDELPSLEEGLQTGAAALDEFEAHIPLLQNGRSWLTSQLGKLNLYFSGIEKTLEKAVDRLSPFFEMLQSWFADVRKWLPFGIGEMAVEIMASITALLMEMPHTISGMQVNVAEPLNVWLDADGDTTKVQNGLLKPIRTKVLTKTAETIAKAHHMDATYRTQLVAQVETAVDRHRALKSLVVDYREAHQL